MPKYVIRMAGETAKPGWIANVNPFVVVCCVSFITRWMAKRTAITLSLIHICREEVDIDIGLLTDSVA